MRVGIAVLSVFGALSLTPFEASAQWFWPAGDGVDAPVISPNLPPLTVYKHSWNEDTVERRYGNRGGTGIVSRIGGWVFGDVLSGPMADFDNGLRDKIVAGCRTFRDSWQQIRCASEAVNIALRGQDTFTRTPCLSRARAFSEVIAALNIPGVSTGYIYMLNPKHILNSLTVTVADGRKLTYAIDTGWNTGRLYPHDDDAKRFHDRNGDGTNEHLELPTLGIPLPRLSWLTPGSLPATGLNVARTAVTNSSIVGRLVVTGAEAAGILR